MTIDQAIIEFDKALRTIAMPAVSARPHPDEGCGVTALGDEERRLSVALMRVNHIGEVCAQALYQGQSITCGTPALCASLKQAAHEEIEHLAWTERRIRDLGGRTSLLAPAFYLGALAMGMLAGKLGDRWNLGFLAETERQVEAHLNEHLQRLPDRDLKSRAIVRQMRDDEVRHADMAVSLGAAELPVAIKRFMKLSAKIMTNTVPHL